jgi:hypothetical protein
MTPKPQKFRAIVAVRNDWLADLSTFMPSAVALKRSAG